MESDSAQGRSPHTLRRAVRSGTFAGRVRVLVVAADIEIREDASAAVAALGHQPLRAPDVATALDLVNQPAQPGFDLVLLGPSAAAAAADEVDVLRDALEDVPIFLIGPLPERLSLPRAVVTAALPWPLDPTELRNLIGSSGGQTRP
jgi:hypothetical protein